MPANLYKPRGKSPATLLRSPYSPYYFNSLNAITVAERRGDCIKRANLTRSLPTVTAERNLKVLLPPRPVYIGIPRSHVFIGAHGPNVILTSPVTVCTSDSQEYCSGANNSCKRPALRPRATAARPVTFYLRAPLKSLHTVF